MANDPQCAALAAAKERTGLSYAAIGQKANLSEQAVIDICTGKQKATDAQFKSISGALGITAEPPHDSAHTTK